MGTPEPDRTTPIRNRGRVFCFTSAKGGSGKTVLAASTAYALLRAGHDVLCIDTDFSTRGLSLLLLSSLIEGGDFEPRSSGCLAEAVLERMPPSSVLPIVVSQENVDFKVLVSNRDMRRGGVPDDRFLGRTGDDNRSNSVAVTVNDYFTYLKELCDAFRSSFDYIILDTRGGFDTTTVVPSIVADICCIVVEADQISIQQVYGLNAKLDEYAKTFGVDSPRKAFVVNKALYAPEDERWLKDVTRLFGGQPLGTVPADTAVIRAYQLKHLPFDVAPESDFSRFALRAIDALVGADVYRWREESSVAWKRLQAHVGRYWRRRTLLEQLQASVPYAGLVSLVLGVAAYLLETRDGDTALTTTAYAATAVAGGWFGITVCIAALMRGVQRGILKSVATLSAAALVAVFVVAAFLWVGLVDFPKHLRSARAADLANSTHYVNDFPRNVPAITGVVDASQRKLSIVTDVCAYGHFSDPRGHAQYRRALINARQRGVDIEMHVYSPAVASSSTADQFDLADPRTSESKFRALRTSPRFTDYVNFRRESGVQIPEPKTAEDFVALMDGEQRTCVSELRDAGIRLSADITAQLPLFIWWRDDVEAIFSMFNMGHNAREVSLVTRDRNLLVMLSEIAARARATP